jgi:glycosyltransferase involved in cell wall biosynthesis
MKVLTNRQGNHNTSQKVVYITARAPWARGEAFVLSEALMMRRHCELRVVPLRPGRQIFHDEGWELAECAVRVPLVCPETIFSLLHLLVVSPRKVFTLIFRLIRHARSLAILSKNMLVLPKAAWMALRARRWGITHLHSHWASTSSTLAYSVSFLTGLPWSVTAHRWDIEEDNMLAEKARTAAFVRVISERGQREVLKRIPGEYAHKIKVIRMGVTLPQMEPAPATGPAPRPVIACVGNLVEVKGHRTLLEACRFLARAGTVFECWIIGQGPLSAELELMAARLGLKDYIKFCGFLPHGEVMRLIASGHIRLYVQPSIRTADGQEEGIPVSLMEALSYGVAVVATRTGAISELIEDGVSGLLVPPGDPVALGDAIHLLLTDPVRCGEFGRKGREVVAKRFGLEAIAGELCRAMGLAD